MTMQQAHELRGLVWAWFLEDEDARWEAYKAVRDICNPILKPIQIALIELCLLGTSGKLSDSNTRLLKSYGMSHIIPKQEVKS